MTVKALVGPTAIRPIPAPSAPSRTTTNNSLVSLDRSLFFPDRRRDQLRQFDSFLRLPSTDDRQDNDCRENHQLNLHSGFIDRRKVAKDELILFFLLLVDCKFFFFEEKEKQQKIKKKKCKRSVFGGI